MIRQLRGAAGYALALVAVAGMAVGVRVDRALGRALRGPIERRANRLWGDEQ